MFKNKKLIAIVFITVIAVAILRLLLTNFQIYDFAPFAAIALFGAAFFSNKKIAYLIPIIALFFSDLILNQTVYAQYDVAIFSKNQLFSSIALLAIFGLGYFWFKKLKTNIISILGSSFLAAVLFFVISNFGVWLTSGIYAKSATGLFNCYVAAIPFFRNAFASNFIYLFTFVQVYKYAFASNLTLAKS